MVFHTTVSTAADAREMARRMSLFDPVTRGVALVGMRRAKCNVAFMPTPPNVSTKENDIWYTYSQWRASPPTENTSTEGGGGKEEGAGVTAAAGGLFCTTLGPPFVRW